MRLVESYKQEPIVILTNVAVPLVLLNFFYIKNAELHRFSLKVFLASNTSRLPIYGATLRWKRKG